MPSELQRLTLVESMGIPHEILQQQAGHSACMHTYEAELPFASCLALPKNKVWSGTSF